MTLRNLASLFYTCILFYIIHSTYYFYHGYYSFTMDINLLKDTLTIFKYLLVLPSNDKWLN